MRLLHILALSVLMMTSITDKAIDSANAMTLKPDCNILIKSISPDRQEIGHAHAALRDLVYLLEDALILPASTIKRRGPHLDADTLTVFDEIAGGVRDAIGLAREYLKTDIDEAIQWHEQTLAEIEAITAT